ncbi:pre-peptidase C-terminal domain-containing protein [Dickeya dianthicola]|uniref:pre-peptidase C-terminal domain-containing protein n=1 Tax=Dickeya dianthicola TaxID=204039 RepID=UPI0030168842
MRQIAANKPLLTKNGKDGVIIIKPDASVLKAATQKKQAKSLSSSQAATSDSTFTPLCPTLSINASYTLSGLQNGGVACYHFEITQDSKTTTYITGQSAGTNMSLMLLSDDGKNNLTQMFYSDNPDNSNEVTINLTKPGHYYWYIEANVTDGSAFTFGSIVNTNIDQYELNDVPSLATIFPDGLYKIKANSDSNFDDDYYAFTAISGQQILLQLTRADNAVNNYWLLSYSTDGGNTWVTCNTGEQNTITPSQPNDTIFVKVSPNPSKLPIPSLYYWLSLGSKIATFTHSVKGESNVLYIPSSAPSRYGSMTTQAYRTVNWNIHVNDSTGEGIPNVNAILYFDQRENNGALVFNQNTAHVISTDASGNASGTITLDTCNADWSTEFKDYDRGYINTWNTTFDFGAWRLEVPAQEDVGVGGKNSKYVTFGHICKQTLIRSVKS